MISLFLYQNQRKCVGKKTTLMKRIHFVIVIESFILKHRMILLHAASTYVCVLISVQFTFDRISPSTKKNVNPKEEKENWLMGMLLKSLVPESEYRITGRPVY